MKTYQTIEFTIEKAVGIITLNRPEIRNAFDDVMIKELIDCFSVINDLNEVKVLLLKGRGKAFCAGADLNWLRAVQKFTFEANYQDSLRLAQCLHAIYTCNKPTLAVIHGAAMGGANGLAAACDLSYCSDDTVFSLSEVKIGIIPAVIAPYVIKRIGEYGARELMLTGARIDGKTAEKYHLVSRSLPANELELFVQEKIQLLKTNGPGAMSHCKLLIDNLVNRLSLPEALEYTARMIAEIRASEEGQEGMAAFLEKRQPSWVLQTK